MKVPKVPLQDWYDSPPQSGHAILVHGNHVRGAAAWQHLCLDFRLNHGAEPLPAPGEIADNHDPLGGGPATIIRMPRPR